jgi:hypothetical protein
MSEWTSHVVMILVGGATAALELILVIVQFLYEMRNRELGAQLRSGSIDRSGKLSFQTTYIGVLVLLVGIAVLIFASVLSRF